jgi:hypothetical protein
MLAEPRLPLETFETDVALNRKRIEFEREVLTGTHGVRTGCARGAQRYSRGTHRVLMGYSRGTQYLSKRWHRRA